MLINYQYSCQFEIKSIRIYFTRLNRIMHRIFSNFFRNFFSAAEKSRKFSTSADAIIFPRQVIFPLIIYHLSEIIQSVDHFLIIKSFYFFKVSID